MISEIAIKITLGPQEAVVAERRVEVTSAAGIGGLPPPPDVPEGPTTASQAIPPAPDVPQVPAATAMPIPPPPEAEEMTLPPLPAEARGAVEIIPPPPEA